MAEDDENGLITTDRENQMDEDQNPMETINSAEISV